MVLGPTQHLTDTGTRDHPRLKGRPARKASNHTAIPGPRCDTTLWASTIAYKESLAFLPFYLAVRTHICLLVKKCAAFVTHSSYTK